MWKIGSRNLESRLLIHTGQYATFDIMSAVHEHSAAQVVTLAVRQADLSAADDQSILNHIDRQRIHLLPTTAGCFTPEDAVSTAHMAAELLETRWIKLVVTGSTRTRLPDMEGTLEAARELVKEGFEVLPHCTDDPILCARLADIGCAGVMVLATPSGSGQGIVNPSRLAMIREGISIPLIVDTGLGTASDATRAMELGADAVLVHSAIADADNPIKMAEAMKLAVLSGRAAFTAGGIPKRMYASSPEPKEDTVLEKGGSAWL